MLIDIIWKAFERTGDAMYYIEYVKFKNLYDKIEKNVRDKDMDKTG